MDDVTIKMLENIHKYVTRSKAHEEYLKTLIENPLTPPAMSNEFIQMFETFMCLRVMLTALNEHNLEVTDQLSDFAAKLEAQIKE